MANQLVVHCQHRTSEVAMLVDADFDGGGDGRVLRSFAILSTQDTFDIHATQTSIGQQRRVLDRTKLLDANTRQRPGRG